MNIFSTDALLFALLYDEYAPGRHYSLEERSKVESYITDMLRKWDGDEIAEYPILFDPQQMLELPHDLHEFIFGRGLYFDRYSPQEICAKVLEVMEYHSMYVFRTFVCNYSSEYFLYRIRMAQE